MRVQFVLVFAAAALVSAPRPSPAQSGPFKVEALKEAPPEALAGPIKEALAGSGYRVSDGKGKPFLDLWMRKAVPAKAKPGGKSGAIQFPILTEGELLGAVRYAVEGGDYRDQAIAAGVYTIRYGLQPVNGDHLGVSEYRDYGLLLPADQDSKVEAVERKALETKSALAAGTNHPAILYLLTAPPDASGDAPTMHHDEEKQRWGAVLPLSLDVQGGGKAPLGVQLIVVGAAPQ